MAGFCTKCGAPLEDDANFCTSCGSVAKITPQPELPAPASKQPVTGQPTSANNSVIVLLLVIIVLLLAGGAYMIYRNQQTPDVATVPQKTSAPSATESNLKTDDTQRRRKACIKSVAEALAANETELADFAGKINSGQFSNSSLLDYESNVIKAIEKRHRVWNKDGIINDSELIAEVEGMFSLQAKRAECMRQGILGNTGQYAMGGQYYDQFQSRFEIFKRSFNL